MQLFTSGKDFICHSIVDERSAGYVALGMARELNEPVILLCTSGTAVLNLAPAVAEAWHQGLPLVVLTADRPRERFSSFDNQWLDQQEPYGPHVKEVLQWPAGFKKEKALGDMLDRAHRLLLDATGPHRGPVHMNLLLEEPLYDELPGAIGIFTPGHSPGTEPPGKKVESQPEYPDPGEKILILAGTGTYDPGLREALADLVKERKVVVVAENLANMVHPDFIVLPELLLSIAGKEGMEALVPDRIYAFGGQVVSKRLKLFLQSLPEVKYYRVNPGMEMDLVRNIKGKAGKGKGSWSVSWKSADKRALDVLDKNLGDLPFSNLHAVHRLLRSVPANTVLHLGNSAAVRYSQLVPVRKDLRYLSNRGTSGIDGCLSAAVGAAMVSRRCHLLLLGDLSFVYDSNALWNRDFPTNLKIVILNDRGGGIFRLLDGPSGMPFSEEFQVSYHPVSLEKLCAAFGLKCLEAGSEEELEEKMEFFFSRSSEPIVLEVDTSGSENSRIFKDFILNNETD